MFGLGEVAAHVAGVFALLLVMRRAAIGVGFLQQVGVRFGEADAPGESRLAEQREESQHEAIRLKPQILSPAAEVIDGRFHAGGNVTQPGRIPIISGNRGALNDEPLGVLHLVDFRRQGQ